MIVECDRNLFEQCKGLWREAFDEDDDFVAYFFEERTSPQFILCDVDEERNLRGMLHMFPKRIKVGRKSFKAMHIVGVAVKIEHRGNGIAAELLKQAEIRAKQQNAAYLILHPENLSLFVFYKKHGYSPLGVHKILAKRFDKPHEVKDEELSVNPELLLSIYKQNMRRADGYVKRNIRHFNALLNEAKRFNYAVVATSTGYGVLEVYADEAFCFEFCGELTACILEMMRQATGKSIIRFDISPTACYIKCEIEELDTVPFNMIKPLNNTVWDTNIRFNSYEMY